MPIRLVPPRPGKTPYWYGRGSYLGIALDRSTKSAKRSVAKTVIEGWERAIERRQYLPGSEAPAKPSPTFLTAAIAYIKAGGERRYLKPLLRRFGEIPITAIDQAAVDLAAAELHPFLGPASRSRNVYCPVQAVIRHAGLDVSFKKPKGFAGRTVTAHLTPEDANALITAARRYDREFALLLTFLLFTGVRIGEALALTWEDMRLHDGLAFVRTSKNGEPRTLRLRRDLCALLGPHARQCALRQDPPAEHPHQTARVFRFHYGGQLIKLLRRATLAVSNVQMPPRPAKGERHSWPEHRLAWVNFHTFRHTWATFMRRYGGADLQGLVATGNWRHTRSASRYAHVAAHEEWDRVERLPAIDLDERELIEPTRGDKTAER